MRAVLAMSVAISVVGGIVGCRSDETKVVVVRDPVPERPVVYREYTRPARALDNTRWSTNPFATTPEYGAIPAGDYVLLREEANTAIPAWIEAIYPPRGQVWVQPEAFRPATFDRVMAGETIYYVGPTVTRDPAGTLPAGTRVLVVREVGDTSEVFTSTGVRTYVRTADLPPRATATVP